MFDGGTFSLDEATTTIDRRARFTVKAQDRFGYSAIEQEFTFDITDDDKTLYSNLYIRPLIKPESRSAYRLFVNDPDIFPPTVIYRPNDPNFGVQQNITMLAYAGIETSTADEFVAKSAKWHKRRNYFLGDVKTAVAKEPGTNDIIYEVVYLEVIDPQEAKKGATAKTFVGKPIQSLTADNISYEAQDDSAGINDGIPSVVIDGRTIDPVVELVGPDAALVITRNGNAIQSIDNADFDVTLQDGSVVNVAITVGDTEPRRARVPNIKNTITSDSDAIIINENNDTIFHITNTTNMRKSLEEIGKSQREYLPLWMRTGQGNNVQELDYITAIPLAYCKPGTSGEVLLNVKNALANNVFDFKSINFDVDRYILDNAVGVTQEQYIVFPNYQYNA